MANHFSPSAAHASGLGAVKDLTGTDVNDLGFLKNHGLSLGGWLSMGMTYTTDDPGHHNNFPVTFNDRSGEFQLNQLYFYAQRPVNHKHQEWSIGGRIDFLFGTDGRFTHATGLDNDLLNESNLRFYDIALPQFYLEAHAPVGNGITIKLGHFYTLIGQETVMAPNNFFYSHSYTMQYGEPFTHTGLLLSYPLNSNFTLNGGAVAGWDNFGENLANWNFLGGLSWTNDDADSIVSWNLVSGDTDDVISRNRTVSSLVISHSFSKKLQYVFQHDFGYEEKGAATGKDALWYGINQYLIYEINDSISAGFRGEWFRDNNNHRINPGSSGNYFALTGGINWKPRKWLTFRPEIRYDWEDARVGVFDNRTRDNQLSVAMDIVIQF